MSSRVENMTIRHLITKRGHFFEALDPRLKLILVVCISTLTFMAPTNEQLLLNYLIIVLLYLFSRMIASGVKVALLVILFFSSSLIHIDGAPEDVNFAFALFGPFIIRLSSYFIMGVWMAGKMRISDFVTSLERMKIPKGIVITLAVIFRYLPTAKDELYYIRSTMKLRGINASFKNLLIHPVRTVEYAIVPMVLRCLTISDELSVSAMTRGLDLSSERTSFRNVRIRAQEVVVTGTILIIVFAIQVLL